jgi:predicted AlkP superfamily phosphohydrolase/phosphomutase
MEDLFDTLTVRARVILDLVGSERWDLFIAVITGTDRLHHFFFDAAGDERHPRHSLFMDYYRKLDDFIGRFNELIGPDTTFMALSDHGFTLLREQIYLNTILQRMGFLKYGSGRPGRLEDVSKNSLAVALDPTRIYVIHRGRFRESGRPESEAPTIINQLKQSLESLTYSDMGLNPEHTSSDSPLFERVLDSVFLYKNGGGYDLPDLVCVPSRGVEVKAAIGAPHTHGKDIFTGTHTHDNAFLLIRSPGGIDAPIEPHITDAARFILSELGSGILL